MDFIQQLQTTLRGTVRTDAVSQALYASDASVYQIHPLGVVAPADEGDIFALLRLARAARVPLIGRGGATSLAGQTVGAGLHVDTVPFLHRVRAFDAQACTVTVQPGLVLDELNRFLAPYNLMFAPDVSPANRATIGGMVGNNSCGMYSLIYGKTIDHVERLKVVLSDGTLIDARPLSEAEYEHKLRMPGTEGLIYRGLRQIILQRAEEIHQRFPQILRRVGGYNLDRLAQATVPSLVDVLVGSEGTLALTLEATLRLVERPAARGIAVLHFPHVFAAVDALEPILAQQPTAVELMDDLLLGLAARSLKYGPYLKQWVIGEPGAVLLVELWADNETIVRERLEAFVDQMQQQQICSTATLAVTAAERAAITAVRKAGQPLLMSYAAGKKPQTCVEDSAVAPERLGAYVRRFKQILDQHQVAAAFYGHASVGLLHIRPLLDLHNPDDVRVFRALSEAVCELVLEFDGALSGEHGDGLLRSEFNERIFGTQLYQAFREIKTLFDPLNLLNPGKITAAPPLDSNLRPAPQWSPATTYRFRESGGMVGAVELCNGNGLCRKTTTGTMCPSFMVTRQEEHSTRGRANALRAVFTGVLPQESFTSERLLQTLDLCLECKACTAECPTGVNMTRLKSEVLHQYQQQHGTSLRSRIFGAARQLNQVGAALTPFANWPLGWRITRLMQEKLLGIARERQLPQFANQTIFQWWRTQAPRPMIHPQKTVLLFPDSWTSYSEPRIAQAAIQVLWAAGYAVRLPARAVCCGRPAFSKGLLDQALRLAQAQLDWLAPYAAAGFPIVGLEPSCILSFRDEYPDVLDDPRAQVLAQQCLTFEEFVEQELNHGRWGAGFKRSSERLLVHQHCHAKALAAPTSLQTTLSLIKGATIDLPDAGCCGMAGSFGYEREHYQISQQIGERVLFPAVRAAPAATIIAPGTSCRQQIREATGRRAFHPAEYLYQQLATREEL